MERAWDCSRQVVQGFGLKSGAVCFEIRHSQYTLTIKLKVLWQPVLSETCYRTENTAFILCQNGTWCYYLLQIVAKKKKSDLLLWSFSLAEFRLERKRRKHTVVFFIKLYQVKCFKYNKFGSNCTIIQTLIDYVQNIYSLYIWLLIHTNNQYYFQFNIWRVKHNTAHH